MRMVSSCFAIQRNSAVSDDQFREPFFSRWCRCSFSVSWTMVCSNVWHLKSSSSTTSVCDQCRCQNDVFDVALQSYITPIPASAALAESLWMNWFQVSRPRVHVPAWDWSSFSFLADDGRTDAHYERYHFALAYRLGERVKNIVYYGYWHLKINEQMNMHVKKFGLPVYTTSLVNTLVEYSNTILHVLTQGYTKAATNHYYYYHYSNYYYFYYYYYYY